MILSALPDFAQIPCCSAQTLPQEELCAVLAKDRTDEAQLRELYKKMGHRLVLREVWKELFPDVPILISSALSGGYLEDRFRQAAQNRSCYLLIEPMCVRYPLPFGDAQGEPIDKIPETGFFSKSLCCRYAHSASHVLLWDTEDTLMQKMQLAKEAGFLGFAAE